MHSHPDYQSWVDRALVQLYSGEKDALLAIDHASIVANAAYQQHQTVPGFIEIKNLRVSSNVRRQNFMSFMLRQVEHTEREDGSSGTIMDVRADEKDTLALATRFGYVPLAIGDLYGAGQEDFITVRWLDTPDTNQFHSLTEIVELNTHTAQQRLDAILVGPPRSKTPEPNRTGW